MYEEEIISQSISKISHMHVAPLLKNGAIFCKALCMGI